MAAADGEQFDYLTVQERHLNNMKSELRKWGKDGWEAVNFIQDQDGFWVALMKKRK